MIPKAIKQLRFSSLFLVVLVVVSMEMGAANLCIYPKWPSEFKWSYAGPVNGMTCVQIHEPADPHTWNDNYFCHASAPGIQGVGMRWSSAGPISGMKCTYIVERAEPCGHTWLDNFLCVPKDSPFNFRWSSAGPIKGLKCVQWLEKSDPHTWNDNYLCM